MSSPNAAQNMLLREGTKLTVHTIFQVTSHVELRILGNSCSEYFAPQNTRRDFLPAGHSESRLTKSDGDSK